MADPLFNHDIPDGTDQVLGGPPTSVADRLRRIATTLYGTYGHAWNNPGQTVLPWAGPVGTVAKQIPSLVSNHLRNLNPGDPGYTNPPPDPKFVDQYAGQYVGPRDMRYAFTMPGYVPQQELQNLMRQDPLAGLLGPMQKPAPVPRPPVVAPGY